MNPFANIEPGSQVIVTKRVLHGRSNLLDEHVGQLFTIYDVEWDGRNHNRFVSCVYVRDKAGTTYRAIVDQLASVNPNYEPLGELIVCTSCGVTIYEDELAPIRGLDLKMCPHCKTIDPANS